MGLIINVEWISIFDKLPEINDPVIILTDYGKCGVCHLAINEDGRTLLWYDDMRPQHTNGSVTHWQSLPFIPKELIK